MSPKRVVVTGMGAISPYGTGMECLMGNLCAMRSAVVNMAGEWLEDIPDLTCQVGAPLQESIDTKAIPRKYRRFMGRTAMLAYVACREALDHARVSDSILSSGKMGTSFASTLGSTRSVEQALVEYQKKNFIKGLSSGIFFQIMSHTCAANIAYAMNIRGRTLSPSAACASSAQAIGLAFETLRHGQEELMLCGGADELHALVTGCFDLVQATSYHFNDRPSETPRPFDRDRDGTVCGEGAGALVLETEESARKRGVEILAEVVGFSTLADGSRLADSTAESITVCLHKVLDNAGVPPSAVDYVNAHGTGTVVGDAAEAQAIREVFRNGNLPVSSLKGHIAHTMGASAALELIASIEMLRNGYLIPTLNLRHPDEEFQDMGFIIGDIEKRPIRTLVKNSFAFGGINAVLVVRRYEDG